jgi:hypothetical protein
MSITFANRTITVIRPGRYQDHGSWYDDWDNPEPDREIEGCIIFAGVSTEDNDRQDAQKVTYTVQAPPDSDVRATDKIRVDMEPDLDLAVYGRPRPVVSPTGFLDHLHIELSDWEVT